jgi:hypothetical protein
MSGYALKQPHPDGSEWIQEFDSLEEAVRFQSHDGGVLVRREPLPGQPGLWWVEADRKTTITEAIESGQGPDGQLLD